VKSRNFLESTKNSHTFGLQYLVGAFLVVPRASTPALIDEVNVLPLLIQMGLHIGHKPVIKIYDKNEQVQIPFLSEEHYQTLELHRKEISNT
jgi:hypothetical protein